METTIKSITELTKEWLSYNRKGDIEGIELLPHQTSQGLVVYFYFEETWEDLPYFLTVPMVKELLDGKNPKKVKNEYRTKKETSVVPLNIEEIKSIDLKLDIKEQPLELDSNYQHENTQSE